MMISRSNWHPMLACGHAANAVCNSKGGIKYDPPIPSCAICSCTEVSLTPPDLSNRKARCCSADSEKISSTDLAFFEYRGLGSQKALTMCQHCNFYQVAHDPEVTKNYVHGKPKNVCDHFRPHGPYTFDTYYCGHSGWD